MPPTRNSLLHQICILGWWSALDPHCDPLVEEALIHLGYRYQQRYLQVCNHHQRVHCQTLDDLAQLHASQFKQLCRTSFASFVQLMNLVAQNPVFSNHSSNPQRDPSIQVAVALSRLGVSGNGASLGKISIIFGIGEGTVVLYTNRLIECLFPLRSQYIKWPTEAERRESSKVMEREGFPGCISFVDGTTFPLSQKPAHQGHCYYDQKKR